MYSSPLDIPPSAQFDIVIISAKSLQDYQNTCAALEPLLHPDAIVVVESTGYVKLELVVHLSLPKHKHIPILLIMNESDVRSVSTNKYWHIPTSPDCRIYFGSSMPAEPELAKQVNFSRMYHLLQTVQQDSNGSINLLKSLSHREFMTYQWKLALPRIVFQPLSIIFETETPQQLADQILCKPLVSGLIAELFKVIKKMECKLVKGFENESNLLKNQISCFSTPAANAHDNSPYSNPLFYSYDQQQDLELDLLLLQPILLADDNGVRTPYLENLYSTMCQYVKINANPSMSIFFERKRRNVNNRLADREHDQANADLEEKRAELNALDEDLSLKLQHHQKTVQELHAQEQKLCLLDAHIDSQQACLDNVLAKIAEAEARLAEQQHQSQMLAKEVEHLQRNRNSFDGNLENYVDPAILNASFGNLVIQDTPQVSQGFEQQHSMPVPSDHTDEIPSDPQNEHSQGVLQPHQLAHSRPAPAVPFGQSQYNPPQSMQGQYLAPAQTQPQYSQQHQQPSQQHQQHQQQPPPPQQQQQPYAPQHSGYQQVNGTHQFHNPLQNADAGYAGANGHVQYQNQGPSYYSQQQGFPQHVPQPHSNQRYQQPPLQYSAGPPLQSGMPGYGAPQHRSQRGTSNGSGGHLEQPPNNLYSLQQIYVAPIDQLLEQRFKSNPKKQNRRSALPQLRSVADAADIGGRAGMPVPSSKQRTPLNGNSAPVTRSMGSSGNLGEYSYASQPQMSHGNQSYQQITPPPSTHKSGGGNDAHISASSSTASDNPPHNGPHSEVAAKPLGGIMPLASEDGKKKRGLFGKKKALVSG